MDAGPPRLSSMVILPGLPRFERTLSKVQDKNQRLACLRELVLRFAVERGRVILPPAINPLVGGTAPVASWLQQRQRLWLGKGRRELERFVKFALVGALGTLIDLSLLNALHGGLGWHLLVANSISFTAAVLSNFTWNRLWTFPETRHRPVTSQLAQFATVSVIGLGINNVVLWRVYHALRPYIAAPWNYNMAKLFAIGVVLFWNFGANRLWTFRDA